MPGGLDEACLHVVGARGLAFRLIQRGPQGLHGVLLDPGPSPLRDPRLPASENRLEAGRSTGRLSYSSPQKA